jgi:hypothetical protein
VRDHRWTSPGRSGARRTRASSTLPIVQRRGGIIGAQAPAQHAFPAPLILILCRCVHGQRVVQLPRITEREPGSAPFVKVLDFSRAAVLAAQGILPRPPSSPTNSPGVLAASSIVRHPYFQGDVETHLPCVSWTRELTKEYDDFLINEDCIIGVQVRFHPAFLGFFIVQREFTRLITSFGFTIHVCRTSSGRFSWMYTPFSRSTLVLNNPPLKNFKEILLRQTKVREHFHMNRNLWET